MSKLRVSLSALVLVLALVVGVIPMAAAAAPAAGAIVTLAVDQASFAAGETVMVRVTIANPTNHSIRVLRWYTPDEELEEPIFVVTRNGEPVSYLGALYKRPAPQGDDYITLKAGESRTYEVDLGAYYDLSVSGAYAIRYAVASASLYAEKDSAAPERAISNALILKIEGRDGITPAAPEAVTGGTTFNKCTTTQQSTLLTARTNASNYAADALSYLSANKQGSRYTTWFGVYNASRYTTVTNHFSAISNAMDGAAVKFDCGCKKRYYAYVYPNQPYTIYLCSVFWTAPMTGTDSKAGTLIHEMSHFTVVVGTDDFVYGQAGAKNLALTDPAKAINNADNHEYFAENTPALQ